MGTLNGEFIFFKRCHLRYCQLLNLIQPCSKLRFSHSDLQSIWLYVVDLPKKHKKCAIFKRLKISLGRHDQNKTESLVICTLVSI